VALFVVLHANGDDGVAGLLISQSSSLYMAFEGYRLRKTEEMKINYSFSI